MVLRGLIGTVIHHDNGVETFEIVAQTFGGCVPIAAGKPPHLGYAA